MNLRLVIYGWVFASHQLGSGAAAFLGGYYHSYTFTFISAGALCIIATLFILGLKKQSQSLSNYSYELERG